MDKIQLSVIEPRAAYVPKPIETKGYGAARYMRYGEDNLYPSYLVDCYEQCATLQSIINGTSDYISGSGFATGTPDMVVNEKGELYSDIVAKATVDYLIYGAFSLGVRRNKEGNIRFIDYHSPTNIRLSEDEKTAYYCKDWKNPKGIVTIPIYKKGDISQDRYELYIKSPSSRGVYGRPIWAAASKDVLTAIEISTFHLSSILNNFTPSAIVNFNNGQPDEERQHEIEKQLNDKFSGSLNAARLLVTWNETKEHAVDIQRLSEDNFDQRYQALAKSVKENIFIAFRAHPQLFGADPERQGFNSVEYVQTFQLFKRTVVEPIQRQIERAFATLGDDFEFTLAEFNIVFDTAEEGGRI